VGALTQRSSLNSRAEDSYTKMPYRAVYAASEFLVYPS
jgi:hypothetical protein